MSRAVEGKSEFVKLLKARMLAQGISKRDLAAAIATSRTQVDRLLDPSNNSVTLQTLMKAAGAVNGSVSFSIEDPSNSIRPRAATRDAARLNEYSDFFVPAGASRGSDIASQRIDELDRHAMRKLLSTRAVSPVCIELGSGLGWQSIRFAVMGASVSMYDLLPAPPLVSLLSEQPNLQIAYHQVDLSQPAAAEFPAEIGFAFAQRFIHYLRYPEALALVREVGGRMVRRGQFFISASGLHSELGTGYRHAGRALDQRFAKLSRSNQQKHGILESVCLYDEADLTRLMKAAGFAPKKVWRSSFGNIKGVFAKAS